MVNGETASHRARFCEPFIGHIFKIALNSKYLGNRSFFIKDNKGIKICDTKNSTLVAIYNRCIVLSPFSSRGWRIKVAECLEKTSKTQIQRNSAISGLGAVDDQDLEMVSGIPSSPIYFLVYIVVRPKIDLLLLCVSRWRRDGPDERVTNQLAEVSSIFEASVHIPINSGHYRHETWKAEVASFPKMSVPV